eukprot:392294-Amphidinium_carterae.1
MNVVARTMHTHPTLDLILVVIHASSPARSGHAVNAGVLGNWEESSSQVEGALQFVTWSREGWHKNTLLTNRALKVQVTEA